jgi:sugar/nucleoside kinase (ribokinase family)
VAVRMGLRVAAVTRLAAEDWHVVTDLEQLGVEVFARPTPHSTCLRLEYPSENPDERVITATSTAGAFTPQEVEDLEARAFVVGASVRGEVGLDVIGSLANRKSLLAVDVQGFLRVARDGRLVHEPWPEKRQVLACVDVLKTDAREAEELTHTADMRVAARMLSEMGPSQIVLTHRDGVLVYAGGTFHETRFYPRSLVGRTGRGDTCLAAYVARRLAASPAEAIEWAAAVTSLKMEAEGPFRRSTDDVQALLRRRYRGQGTP